MTGKTDFHTSISLHSHNILESYSSDGLTGEQVNKSTIINAALKLLDAKLKGDPATLEEYLKEHGMR